MRAVFHAIVCLAVLCAFVEAPTGHRHDRPGHRLTHTHFTAHAHEHGIPAGPRISERETITTVDLFLCAPVQHAPAIELAAALDVRPPEPVHVGVTRPPAPSAHGPPATGCSPLRAPPA